jgi:hypothetical protein
VFLLRLPESIQRFNKKHVLIFSVWDASFALPDPDPPSIFKADPDKNTSESVDPYDLGLSDPLIICTNPDLFHQEVNNYEKKFNFNSFVTPQLLAIFGD